MNKITVDFRATLLFTLLPSIALKRLELLDITRPRCTTRHSIVLVYKSPKRFNSFEFNFVNKASEGLFFKVGLRITKVKICYIFSKGFVTNW